MFINLVKQILHKRKKKENYEVAVYRYKNLTYCCNMMRHNTLIGLHSEEVSVNVCEKCNVKSNDDCNYCSYYHGDNYDKKYVGMMLEQKEEIYDPWDDSNIPDYTYDYYPVEYCPFCGEQVQVYITEEEDIEDYVKNAEEKLIKLNNKRLKEDSKKKERELDKKWRDCENLLSGITSNDVISYKKYKEMVEELNGQLQDIN